MNLKKILFSLATIAVVAGAGLAVSGAYFNDTEVSNNNSLTTGTIDISVNDLNPWSYTGYALNDMKPGQVDHIDFTVKNVGSNPANIYKLLNNFQTSDVAWSEPKCVARGGTWVESTKTCTAPTGSVADLKMVTYYDLNVEVRDAAGVLQWTQTQYTLGDNQTLNDVYTPGRVTLGMLPSGWTMKVYQSYHLDEQAGNTYQGEKLTFDITLTAEQLGQSALRLENKTGANTDQIVWDTRYATLSYGVKDREFSYTLNVYGMTDGAYTLISFKDPWPGATSIALANVTVSGGTGTVTGSVELGQDLINAKTWLVPGTFTPGLVTGALSWNPANTLSETGLMDYYNAD